jgi:hypothetical protein
MTSLTNCLLPIISFTQITKSCNRILEIHSEVLNNMKSSKMNIYLELAS